MTARKRQTATKTKTEPEGDGLLDDYSDVSQWLSSLTLDQLRTLRFKLTFELLNRPAETEGL